MTKDETYLGDGLYASFDGWQIQIRAPRENGNHFIYLEPYTWQSLKAYAAGRLEEDKGDET